MTLAVRIESEVYDGESYQTVARVVGQNGSPVIQSGVTDWDLRVYDETSATPDVSVYSLSSQPASTIMQTGLVVDGYWTSDGTGYTMRHLLSGAAFTAQGGGVYRLEYRLNTVLWGVIPVVHRVSVRPLTYG